MVEETSGMNIILAISCAFGSPFGEEILAQRIIDLYQMALSFGVKQVGLADTTGTSTPLNMRLKLLEFKKYIDIRNISLHLHDAWGMGLANAFVALEEGISQFDAALGGLGGCPFAPGAKGNIATEDLVNMAVNMGFKADYDQEAVIAVAREMGGLLRCKINSSMANVCNR
jgi:hydroxymethylglutaryl-CoA lyase